MITTQKILNGKFSLEMHTYGSGGEPLLFMHGAGGLMPVEPFLEDLGKHFKVYAPQFPGYGDSTGNEYIDDIADAVLFLSSERARHVHGATLTVDGGEAM